MNVFTFGSTNVGLEDFKFSFNPNKFQKTCKAFNSSLFEPAEMFHKKASVFTNTNQHSNASSSYSQFSFNSFKQHHDAGKNVVLSLPCPQFVYGRDQYGEGNKENIDPLTGLLSINNRNSQTKKPCKNSSRIPLKDITNTYVCDNRIIEFQYDPQQIDRPGKRMRNVSNESNIADKPVVYLPQPKFDCKKAFETAKKFLQPERQVSNVATKALNNVGFKKMLKMR